MCVWGVYYTVHFYNARGRLLSWRVLYVPGEKSIFPEKAHTGIHSEPHNSKLKISVESCTQVPLHRKDAKRKYAVPSSLGIIYCIISV